MASSFPQPTLLSSLKCSLHILEFNLSPKLRTLHTNPLGPRSHISPSHSNPSSSTTRNQALLWSSTAPAKFSALLPHPASSLALSCYKNATVPSKLLTYAKRRGPSLAPPIHRARTPSRSSHAEADSAPGRARFDPTRTLRPARVGPGTLHPLSRPGRARGLARDPKGRGSSTWLGGRCARLRLRPGPRGGRAPVPARAAALGLAAAGALARHLRVGLAVVAGPTAGPSRAADAAALATWARGVGGALGAASAQRVAARQGRRFPRGLQAPGAARLLRPRRWRRLQQRRRQHQQRGARGRGRGPSLGCRHLVTAAPPAPPTESRRCRRRRGPSTRTCCRHLVSRLRGESVAREKSRGRGSARRAALSTYS